MAIYEVEYVGDFPHLPAGNIVVRVLLLLWTGDYPAQCEVGKFIKGGIDKTVSMLDSHGKNGNLQLNLQK